MKTHMILPLALSLPLLAGCEGVTDRFRREAPTPAAAAAPVMSPGPVIGGSGAQTADTLDSTTPEERAAALGASSGGEVLGNVVVVLGNAGEPGFWVRSSRIDAPRRGRVETAAGGSVAVDLLPGAGASQMSLAAYRALDLPLTSLPAVTIYAE